YHHGSSVCAAKVRFALAEKGVEWNSHYLDILAGDQFDPEYMKLNPKAVVPTIVHNDQVIVESTVICEYIDEVFDGPSLVPDTPLGRAQMRLWTKAVDEDIHPACGEVTFVSCHRYVIMRLGEEGMQEFLNATPPRSVTSSWKQRKRDLVMLGIEAPGIGAKIKLYDRYLSEMEAALSERAWLAGDTFSLADIGLTPYVNRLDMLGMSGLWDDGRRPHVEDWFNRIKARPTFKPMFLDWCPEELTNDLMTFGTQTFPKVLEILGRSEADCEPIQAEDGMCMCAIG
ncbi:MAG: glutathione S-transferase family protein, partial [Chloroflexota bacterium]